MEINLPERKAQLDDLSKFIRDAENTLGTVLGVLGWDGDTLKKKTPEMVTCPLNKEHRLPADKLEKHLVTCSWRSEGYHEEHVPLPESCGPGESSIMIDKETRTAVIREALAQDSTLKTGLPAVGLDDRPVPKTADRLTSDFTVDERRVLYDYAISQSATVSSVKVEDFDMPFKKEEKEKPKSFLERLAAERDAKRRKVGKKVHTNRKSQVEILREVINNQMEAYTDYLKQEFPENKSPEQSSQSQIGGASPASERISADWERAGSSRRTYERHSSYADDRLHPEKQSYRRTEFDRRDERRSYRDRRYDSYHENRRDNSYRKYSRNERDDRYKDERSKNYDSYNEHRRQDAEDYNSRKRYRDRSVSYDSEKRHHRDHEHSYEQRNYRSNRRYKSRSRDRSNDRHRSRSYETPDRKRYHDRSRKYAEMSKDSSDVEESYGKRWKSQKNGSDVHSYKDTVPRDVSPQSFYTALSNIKSETESVYTQNESYGDASKDVEERHYKRSKREVCESEGNESREENSDGETRKSRHKGKHKKRKHKKHKKHHRKSVHKSDESRHSTDDFSC